MTFTRYALYYAPRSNAGWGRWASEWLGWDLEAGRPLPHPEAGDLAVAEVTQTPRKYGLHATIKPPLRLAAGCDLEGLKTACAALAAQQAPVTLDGLEIARLGRFLALRTLGDESALNALAAASLRALDPYRAPAPEAELARRRAAGLSPAQEENLRQWGYPYVLDQFKFHITLSGKLDKATLAATEALLAEQLAPLLPRPFEIRDLALVGEDSTGRFHLLHRYPLTGSGAA